MYRYVCYIDKSGHLRCKKRLITLQFLRVIAFGLIAALISTTCEDIVTCSDNFNLLIKFPFIIWQDLGKESIRREGIEKLITTPSAKMLRQTRSVKRAI